MPGAGRGETLGQLGKQPVHIQGWIRFSGEGPPPPSQSPDDFIIVDGTPDALSPPYMPLSAADRHYATAPVTLKEFEAGEAATAEAPALFRGAEASNAAWKAPQQQEGLPEPAAPGESQKLSEQHNNASIRLRTSKRRHTPDPNPGAEKLLSGDVSDARDYASANSDSDYSPSPVFRKLSAKAPTAASSHAAKKRTLASLNAEEAPGACRPPSAAAAAPLLTLPPPQKKARKSAANSRKRKLSGAAAATNGVAGPSGGGSGAVGATGAGAAMRASIACSTRATGAVPEAPPAKLPSKQKRLKKGILGKIRANPDGDEPSAGSARPATAPSSATLASLPSSCNSGEKGAAGRVPNPEAGTKLATSKPGSKRAAKAPGKTGKRTVKSRPAPPSTRAPSDGAPKHSNLAKERPAAKGNRKAMPVAAKAAAAEPAAAAAPLQPTRSTTAGGSAIDGDSSGVKCDEAQHCGGLGAALQNASAQLQNLISSFRPLPGAD